MSQGITVVKTKMKIMLMLFVVLLQIPPGFAGEMDSAANHANLVVESIEISGATKTRHTVILKHMSFAPGDSINADIIAADLQTLKLTKFFKQVDIFTRPGNERGHVIVEISVQERWFPSFHFEGGHTELDGWYISPLALRFDNLLGLGYHTGLKTYVSENCAGLNFFHANDRFLNPALQYYFEVSVVGRVCPHYVDNTLYSQLLAVTSTQLNLTPAKAIPRLTVGIGVQKMYPEKHMTEFAGSETVKYELPAEIAAASITTTALRLNLTLSRDTRNHTLYPTQGFWGRLVLDRVTELDHAAYRYSKGLLDARIYRTVHGRSVAAARIKLATTEPAAPFHDRFYLGGVYSVRGYEEYTLTPVGWGTQLALFNMEYRFPLHQTNFPNHRWTAVFFLDSGAIRKSGNEDAVRFYHSLGVGLCIRLPIIGLLRLDCGIPLTRKPVRFTTTSGSMF